MTPPAKVHGRPDGARRPVVFLGPTAPKDEIRGILPQCTILPPVSRGQLHKARERGGAVFLIVDGAFAHTLAVSPREVLDVLRDGAVVYGASSMGALRAAECWPAGMRGVGTITRLYRLGLLSSDDEVAVAMNPGGAFAAASVALINVRYAASKASKIGLIDRACAKDIVAAAKETYFPERAWPSILRRAGVRDSDKRVQAFCASADLKRKDARRAAGALAHALRTEPGLCTARARRDEVPFVSAERYPGHDPLLGRAEADLRRELAVWLLGSGRYQKYVWPLVLGEPEFRGLRRMNSPERRAEALRVRLAEALARFCSDLETLIPRLFAELEFMEETEAEIMRWHSVRASAEHARGQNMSAARFLLERTREEVAIAHGVRDWQMLLEEAGDGLLFGAIPLGWIESACADLSLAKTFTHYRASAPAGGGAVEGANHER